MTETAAAQIPLGESNASYHDSERPRCRSMWHLHVPVLQHDGIRVSLSSHRFQWSDENGRILVITKTRFWSSSEVNKPLSCREKCVDEQATILNDWTLPAADSAGRTVAGPQRARVTLGAQPLLEKTCLGRHLKSRVAKAAHPPSSPPQSGRVAPAFQCMLDS